MSIDKIFIYIKKLLPRRLFKIVQPPYHYLLSWFSAFFYGYPSEDMIIVGVTGTTGKTTSVYLIAKTLEECGLKVGFTSTAMFNDGQKEWLNDKKMTMVGRFFTQKILKDMSKNGCQVAIVETTSEGVRQYRHRFINFDILICTGLYPEHIESHGSFENYKTAKGQLFKHLKACRTKFIDDNYKVHKLKQNLKKLDFRRVKKTIIANGDDEHAEYFLSFWSEEKYCFFGDESDTPLQQSKKDHIIAMHKDIKVLKYWGIEQREKGICFTAGFDSVSNWHQPGSSLLISLKIYGLFNAANAMTAVATSVALGLSQQKIKVGLEKIEGVAGRLEKIDAGQDFTVIVDYAFEPKAVEKLYETVAKIPHAKIIHVLGSTGGGRDVSRRPILGRIAGSQADIVIVTDEDPYDEDPNIIIDQVATGAEKAGKKLNQDLFKILDRRSAIQKAVALAETNDIVLITGKGNEQAIVVKNGEKIPWDDRAVVRGILANK